MVQVIRSKNYQMKIEDLLLLMNFVNSSASMRSSETWTPICVPGINANAYVYAYIDFLATDLCFIMICTNQDQFFECSQAKHLFVQAMVQSHLLEPLISAVKAPSVHCNDLKVNADLRHFVYLNVPINQFMNSHYSPPYNALKERKRLCRVYKNVREQLRHSKSHNKIYFHATNKECVLGWISATFELYASFSLTTSKAAAIAACEAIKKWVKREEDDIFVANFKTF